jgi:hypothetical protein
MTAAISCTRILLAMALVASGLCMAQGAPAPEACVVLAGTADGFNKETAVSRAQLALTRRCARDVSGPLLHLAF